jgi:hypothetical protein
MFCSQPQIKDQVSPGYCFKVTSKKIDDQLDEVCKAYNVEVDKENVPFAEDGDAASKVLYPLTQRTE